MATERRPWLVRFANAQRLCLHLAEVTRRVLAVDGIDAEVCIGAIELMLGRDCESPLSIVYDPNVVAGEWHAWLRAGEWLVDPSMADLHHQIVLLEVAPENVDTYAPRALFDQTVLVASASRLRTTVVAARSWAILSSATALERRLAMFSNNWRS